MKPKYEVGQMVYYFMLGSIVKSEIVSVDDYEGDWWYLLRGDARIEKELFTTREEGIAMFESMMDEVGL